MVKSGAMSTRLDDGDRVRDWSLSVGVTFRQELGKQIVG